MLIKNAAERIDGAKSCQPLTMRSMAAALRLTVSRSCARARTDQYLEPAAG